ncbi:TPA: hypothetical protein PBQ24_003793 [Escherichia coli]|nr:hypothetical protein [Escherichia coli]
MKRAYHKTTNSHHRFYQHPNLLKPGPEQVTALEPEQVWVADITYLPLLSGMAYLSLVTNACTRKSWVTMSEKICRQKMCQRQ